MAGGAIGPPYAQALLILYTTTERKNRIMGLFDRISRVIKANINDLVSKAEDPEKLLEQSLLEMQEDMVQLRQAVASAIASQKRFGQQCSQAQDRVNTWHQRAQLALQKGDENLAREALQRKKTHVETATTLKGQLEQQNQHVDNLKRNLQALEAKISEAKTKKDMLKARLQAAKAQEQLQETVGKIGTSSAAAAFDRMEEKVLQIEARAGAAGELAGDQMESKLAALGGSDVDEELAQMKAQIGSPSLSPGRLLAETASSDPGDDADELEKLRRELDKM